VFQPDKGKDDTWTEVPDLYAFLREDMFHAATSALCGNHIFRLNPDFGRDFWEFHKYTVTYFRRLPRWMARK
jgi:hypothetical protein